MRRIGSAGNGSHSQFAEPPFALFDIAATRRLEQGAAAALPPHTLMQRAGLAVARLAMAIAPGAHGIWIACGPGNNGGDGFEAATQLQLRGLRPIVTRIGQDAGLPPDALASLQRARAAGVRFADEVPAHELAIDALLGIGAARPPAGRMAEWLQRMHAGPAPLLSIDTPSGLDADRGVLAFDFLAGAAPELPRHCLSLLALKPGLFTAQGRDAAGQVWFEDLGVDAGAESPVAQLAAPAPPAQRWQSSHKGSYGDVAVIGGAPGMAGAALLASTAALSAGAGRVYVAALDAGLVPLDLLHPELMFRSPGQLDPSKLSVVCGCGGGSAVAALLPRVIREARQLVLDADALNAIAADAALQALLEARGRDGRPTVLTPHPLEAARLLGSSTTAVQSDRLKAAHELALRFGAAVVLKGSGSVIAAPGQLPLINPSGNARLATAGTGDVLAGMVGAALADGSSSMQAAARAVWRHGDLADRWPGSVPLTAGALALGFPPAGRPGRP